MTCDDLIPQVLWLTGTAYKDMIIFPEAEDDVAIARVARDRDGRHPLSEFIAAPSAARPTPSERGARLGA